MADKISFAHVQLNPGVTPPTAPNALSPAETGGTTGIANRAFVAIAGDGDQTHENGETAYVLGGAQRSNRLTGADTLNGAGDPAGITVHGRIDTGTVGALGLDANLGFSPSFGFGVKNGSEGGVRNLKRGDSITWTLNEQAGVPQRLQKAAFTVDRNRATEVAFDFDGNVVKSGSYAIAQTAANADAALQLAANGGDTIAIDFDASILTVNGVARTGAAIDTFFAHYAASPQNVLTIGGIGTAGFSVKDLTLDRVGFDGPPPNTAPTVALTPTAVVLTAVNGTLAENADTTQAMVVATIAVTDDGLGVNALSLSGEDANLFEIVNNQGTDELRLIAGAALDFETNPALDVTVAVDDDTAVGANPDAPEATAPFSLLHIEGPTKMPNTLIKNGLSIENFNDVVL